MAALPSGITAESVRQFVDDHPELGTNRLEYIRQFLKERKLHGTAGLTRIAMVVAERLDEVYGQYVIITSSGAMLDEVYVGLEKASTAAVQSGGIVVLVKSSWGEPGLGAAKRFVALFPDEPDLQARLMQKSVQLELDEARRLANRSGTWRFDLRNARLMHSRSCS